MSAVELQLVELPGHFAQVQLTGLKEMLDHHRANGHRVQFNAANVDRIDGAAVQFLVAVSKLQSGAAEAAPTVVNTNEVVLKALEDMGVAEYVSMEVVASDDTTA